LAYLSKPGEGTRHHFAWKLNPDKMDAGRRFKISFSAQESGMALRDSLKSLFKTSADADAGDACVLIGGPEELDEAIRTRDKLMVLFYATWCPFSRAFLETYQAHAAAGDPCYARIIVDDGDPLVEKYAIEVFPTVLFFEKGRLARRLDGAYHRGLSQGQLEDFARRCAVK
jgi:thioredoxin 1